MRPLKVLFIALTTALICSQAHAWREGNGGDGIRVQSRLYLLDLVEQGVENTTSDLRKPVANNFFEKEVSAWAMSQSHAIPTEIILDKLGAIQRKNSLLAHLIVMSLRQLEWTWINVPLRDIKDQGVHTVVDNKKLEQLALRVNQTVHIQKDLWNELDEKNKAALIFHEVLFALVQPKRTPEGLSMSSPRVRRINGFIFSKRIHTDSLDQILKIEAPEFRFTSLTMKPLELFHLNLEKGEMLFNAHWFLRAETTKGESTILNEVGLHKSEIQTVRHICDFAEDKKATLYVGIAADQLNVSLSTAIPDVQEDFYLIHSFYQDSPVISMPVEPQLTNENCVHLINDIKSVLIQDFTINN